MATGGLMKDGDDTKTQETRVNRFYFRKLLQVMSSYGKEILFLITLIFTGIAALQNGPLKTKKVNPPQLFFQPPSLITDFYTGKFHQLLTVVSEKDVSFVMYYAPWDAACMQAREELELAARFYHNEVFFASINCWWPEGECSKKFNPVGPYPMFVVVVHEFGSFFYNGPAISTYIISFLDSVLNPIVPLHQPTDLLELQTKHEGVLVGFFDFQEDLNSGGYYQFYQGALKSLSKDPFRRICFAVVTNQISADILKLQSTIQLFLWDSIKLLITNKSMDYNELINWAYSNLKQVTEWISPLGSKSAILSESVENHPSIILFTPRNLLLEYSPYYNLFKEIALNYNNCNKSSHTESLVHRMVLKRHIMQEEFSRTIEKCQTNETNLEPDICHQRPDLCDFTCCQSLKTRLKTNSHCICRACLHHIVATVQAMKFSECEKTLDLILQNFNFKDLGNFTQCSEVEVSLPVKFGEFKHLSFHCEAEIVNPSKSTKKSLTEKEMHGLNDDLIITMISNSEKRLCHRLRYAMNSSELNFPHFPLPEGMAWITNFTGLGCRTNRTLNFIAMDVMLYYSFAENLGMDISNKYHQTGAVIIEAKHENQYVLNGEVNKKSLVEFIKNYTAGTLTRHLRMPVRQIAQCKPEDSNICLQEVTTLTFSEIVLDDKHDIILFYYAPWCGMCQSIAHVFLSVADYFSKVKGIKFVRINGDENDLPWEYTVDKYPSIVFFPAIKKSDSVQFPSHLEVTLTNLLHFSMVHAQQKVRWRVAMEMCNWDCITHNLVQSASELRRLHRELRHRIDDLHFTQWVIENEGLKRNVNYLKSVHLKSVVERIRKKKHQIKKAVRLQETLMKRKALYLEENDKGKKKSKRVDLRTKPKDEL